MVKYKKAACKILTKGEVPFRGITEIVKYRKTALKPSSKGEVPFG